MGKMRAAHAVKLKTIVCKEIEIPHVTDNRVLVKTKLSSICGSDLHVVNMGYTAYASDFPLPYGAPGHEGVGKIVESRSPDFSEGESVLTVPNILVLNSYSFLEISLNNNPPLCFIYPSLVLNCSKSFVIRLIL